jgi:hypothetical protein
MNYKRIYDEFIADRRIKEHFLTENYEWHHVEPICRWPKNKPGLNDPENLIRLTYADHLFAHVLLAWAHGGRGSWFAVTQMIGNRQPRGRKTRAWFDMNKRQASLAQKAEYALMTPEERKRSPGTLAMQDKIALMSLEERRIFIAPAVAGMKAAFKAKVSAMTPEERKTLPGIVAIKAKREAMTPEELRIHTSPGLVKARAKLASLTPEELQEVRVPVLAAANAANRTKQANMTLEERAAFTAPARAALMLSHLLRAEQAEVNSTNP